MSRFSPAVQELELYEFRYGLAELLPEKGWDSVKLETEEEIETHQQPRLLRQHPDQTDGG